jgi:hypothetical protein
MKATNEQTTYTVNGEPVGEDPSKAAVEPTTEAEIEEFDRRAREVFEHELARCQEIQPGSNEAEAAVRSAIRSE